MSKGRLYIAAAAVLIVIIIIIGGVGLYSGLPHGYDGPVAGVDAVEHDYTPNNLGTSVQAYTDWYYTGVNPPSYLPYTPGNPTGIKTRITAPQYISHEDLDPIIREEHIEIEGESYVRENRIEVSIVKFDFTILLETYSDGSGTDHFPINNVVFWYRIQNNPYSVFQGADETAIAVLSVRTVKVELLQRAESFNFEPQSGGADVPLYTVTRGNKLPEGVEEEYNAENLRRFQDVKFPVVVDIADPIENIIDGRVDCLAKLFFRLEVLLFGQWEELRPYQEVIVEEPTRTFWERLGDAVGGIFGALSSWLGAVVVVVGVIGTVIVVTRTKGWIMVFGVVLIWIAVVFVLGMIGLSVVAI